MEGKDNYTAQEVDEMLRATRDLTAMTTTMSYSLLSRRHDVLRKAAPQAQEALEKYEATVPKKYHHHFCDGVHIRHTNDIRDMISDHL